MRLAIAQLNFKIGAFRSNLERMRQAVASAREQRADLVLFTELATVGYPPRDLLDRPDFVRRNLEQLERVAALSDDDLGIVVGYAEPDPSGAGKGLFNSAALCHRGRVVDSYRKCLLPTYDVFDEARYFEPGPEARPLVFKGIPLGVTVCEDAWNDPDFWPRRLYRRDPVAELVAGGARLLLNISASPFTVGKGMFRRDMLAQEAVKHRRYLFCANQVGGQDELVFDGHSLGIDPCGETVLRADDFAEDLLVYEVPDSELELGHGRPGQRGVLRPVAETAAAEVCSALVLGLADYASKCGFNQVVPKCGFNQVVLGLSGGIDSALTAAVAAEALGADNVLGVAMPTRYSSEASLSDARALADNLDIELAVIPVDAIYQVFLDALAPTFAGLAEDVTEENIQARARGSVLMALSNKLGRLLVSTGNKSELAVGYCTLYGDMNGGLAVLSDVPKTLVYELARHVNRERELIPQAIFDKPPSAELRPDQTDQDSLPPYEVLDRIVEAYVEQGHGIDDMVELGMERDVVEEIVLLIDRNEYKRRQAAPGLKTTSKAVGLGRRFPIAADHRGSHGG